MPIDAIREVGVGVEGVAVVASAAETLKVLEALAGVVGADFWRFEAVGLDASFTPKGSGDDDDKRFDDGILKCAIIRTIDVYRSH